MNFRMVHSNRNILDLKKSMDFYQEALNLHEAGRIESPDGSFIIVYLGSAHSEFQLELTWLRDHHTPYNLGDNEIHLAFTADDFEAALTKHRAMGCVCYENPEMGIYFISDPDGYWLEILPDRKIY